MQNLKKSKPITEQNGGSWGRGQGDDGQREQTFSHEMNTF